jgi:hypothetical protein
MIRVLNPIGHPVDIPERPKQKFYCECGRAAAYFKHRTIEDPVTGSLFDYPDYKCHDCLFEWYVEELGQYEVEDIPTFEDFIQEEKYEEL